MHVDNFYIVLELSVDRFGVSTFFAVQSEEPAPTGGAIRTVVYQSKVAIPRDTKHSVISLLDEVSILQRQCLLSRTFFVRILFVLRCHSFEDTISFSNAYHESHTLEHETRALSSWKRHLAVDKYIRWETHMSKMA